MLIETSQDIFWLVLSSSIGLLTIFTVWGIFYVIMIIRRGSRTFKGVEQIIENINQITKTAREKLEHGAAYVSVFADAVKKVTEVVKEQGKSAVKKRRAGGKGK